LIEERLADMRDKQEQEQEQDQEQDQEHEEIMTYFATSFLYS